MNVSVRKHRPHAIPFTDLSGDKRRPALVVSRDNDRRPDVVVCFITSVNRVGLDLAAIEASPQTGLRVSSVVRFDKIATVERSIVAGKPGQASDAWLLTQSARCYRVFGFVRADGRNQSDASGN